MLTASVLAGDAVVGQDGPDFATIEPVSEPIQASTHVAVIGDGFLAAPAIGPLVPDSCMTSTNGPVERAARQSPGLVIVENHSCVDATLLSVSHDQVPELDSDVDVVVIGGVGLEFDWETLADVCLHRETRSADACSAESSLARATAANSFFSWRALLQQVHRAAPDATIVLLSPAHPVSSNPLPLGSRCCSPSTDGHAQIRSVFTLSLIHI